jgi:hypothetical protein
MNTSSIQCRCGSPISESSLNNTNKTNRKYASEYICCECRDILCSDCYQRLTMRDPMYVYHYCNICIDNEDAGPGHAARRASLNTTNNPIRTWSEVVSK